MQRLRMSSLALLVAVASSAAAHAAQPAPLEVVQTKSGPVRGIATDVVAFKGVPFAAPPVGPLRWRPPVAAQAWTAPRDATVFGAICPQPGRGPNAPAVVGAEDCLTLNVWTAARAASAGQPVFVWIHGGGFQFNAGSLPEFDGAALARRGIVVVTVNYRMGPLGFLAHPALSDESPRNVSGNYGFLDQIAALQWVRENIAAFGGDPRNVTLGGESAGAMSTAILMSSSLARGLFRRAILMSLPRALGPFQKLRDVHYGERSAEAQGAATAPDIQALRSLPAAEIIVRLRMEPTFSSGTHYFPIIDGYVLPRDFIDVIDSTDRPRMPMLFGYTSDEGLFFKRDAPTTVAGYRAFVASRVAPQLIAAVEERYPARTDAEAADAAQRMFGDSELIASTIATARKAAARDDVYVYQFARVSPANRKAWGGAAHTIEVPYALGNLAGDDTQLQARDRALSREMSEAWAQFIKTGSPNGPGLPAWPKHQAPEFRELVYGDETKLGSNAGDRRAELFERAAAAARDGPLLPR